ncbi:MAG: DUF4870 domain-containing protein [Myxococcaceae bacterium]|nr:DUF4870 domain-containing protein [Myxococcaceae bacterium]
MEDLAPQDKTMAAVAHLSGLAGYVIPLGGALVPLVIMFTSSSKTIATIAKQALWLNAIAYAGSIIGVLAYMSLVGIPCALGLWGVLAVGAVLLPIVGAIKATEGKYYRYPVVGFSRPRLGG